MSDIEKLEKRWAELVNKPKSKDEIEEIIFIGNQLEVERAKEYQGLIAELSHINIKIKSIWDLVNTKCKYPEAISILMKYLPLVKNSKNKEGIIRALTVPEAKGQVIPLLLKEYLKLSNDQQSLKWLIGNAVFETISINDVKDIFPIVLNKDNGESRQMFVAALGKIKMENVKNILNQLIEDEDNIIKKEVEKALSNF